MPLQNGFRRRIGFLEVHAPISEFLQRIWYAGYRATHESARPHDAKIAIEVFYFGFSRSRG